MAVIHKRPNDISGRIVAGERPLVIPTGSEATNAASLVNPGIKINETTGGLDVYFNGGRVSLLGTSTDQVPVVELGAGDTYKAKSDSVTPIRMLSAGITVTLETPDAPKPGETISFYDTALMLDSLTRWKFTGVLIDGTMEDRYFAIKGGLLELEWVGGSVGWRSDSRDFLTPLLVDATNHTDENTHGTVVTAGTYRVLPSATAVCPVDHTKISVGERVHVWYYKASPFKLIHGREQHVIGAPHARYCNEALITYLKVPGGMVVEAAHYVDSKFETQADWQTFVDTYGIEALSDTLMYNFDFTNWDYIQGKLATLFPVKSPVRFNSWLKTERSEVYTNVIPDDAVHGSSEEAIRVECDRMAHAFAMVKRYNSAGDTVLSPMTVDLGRPATLMFEAADVGTPQSINRVSWDTRFHVLADGVEFDMRNCMDTYHINDEITILARADVVTSEGITLFTLSGGGTGNDMLRHWDADNGVWVTVADFQMTGPGVCTIRKIDDDTWDIVHKSSF